MAYSRIASQDQLGTASTTSVNATYPAATQAGDLLIATVYSSGVAIGTPAISGWTLAINESFLSVADASTIFYRIADGTETIVTATCTSATSMAIAIHEFINGNLQAAQTWLDQTGVATAGLGTTLSMGSITPTKPNELIICGATFPTGGTSAWVFPGMAVMSSNVNMADAFVVSQNINAFAPSITWTGASTAGGCVASFFDGSEGDTMFRHVQVDTGLSKSEVAN